MKIELKSNYDKFSKRLFNFLRDLTDTAIPISVDKFLSELCDEMKAEIQTNLSEIREGSGLDLESFDDITYEFDESTGEGTIHVGKNTPVLVMSDGRTVNPYMFIQFGYGIVGEENPVKYHLFNRWEYNINEHTKAWTYIGANGETYWTRGRKGINFFYNVIDRNRHRWKEIVKNEILDYFNPMGGK